MNKYSLEFAKINYTLRLHTTYKLPIGTTVLDALDHCPI